jgi:hypothetical protein
MLQTREFIFMKTAVRTAMVQFVYVQGYKQSCRWNSVILTTTTARASHLKYLLSSFTGCNIQLHHAEFDEQLASVHIGLHEVPSQFQTEIQIQLPVFVTLSKECLKLRSPCSSKRSLFHLYQLDENPCTILQILSLCI